MSDLLRRVRRLTRAAAVLAPLALLAGTLSVAGTAAASPSGPGAHSAPRSETASARALARWTGQRVEVVGLRTATGQVFANPSGTFTAVEHATPAGSALATGTNQSAAVGAANWTMINQRHPYQSYWSYDRSNGARVGYVEDAVDGWERYRSVFTFSTAGFAGKTVLDASMSAVLTHSWSCVNSRTDLWQVGTVDSGTTWNNHAATWSSNLASVSNQSCTDIRTATTWHSTALTGRTQNAADSGSALTLGVRAYDESTHNGWKKFDPASVVLQVTYTDPAL